MKEDIEKKLERLKKGLSEIKNSSLFEREKEEMEKLNQKIQEKNFWQSGKEAAKTYQIFNQLKEDISHIEDLKGEIKRTKALVDLGKEKEAEDNILLLERKIKTEEEKTFLSKKYDRNSAILTIQAGTGGRDAEDWVVLLLRMYQRWAERRRFKTKTLFRRFGEAGGPEGRIGLKEISMEIKGNFAYGLLRRENGVHRLVRISPFSAKKLRHTSFASVEVLPKIEDEEEKKLVLKLNDLKIETFRSSGPGGQYVNKRDSAVRITHIPTGLKAESQVERLQGLNRRIALNVLTSKLIQMKENEKEKKLKKLKGKKVLPDFGNHIRSYVFQPYKLIKDQRTKVETSDVEGVLDGDLDDFIDSEVRRLA